MARRAQQAIPPGGALIVAAGSTASIDYPGGNGTLFMTGTFGGTSAQLQQQAPDGTWVSMISPLTVPGAVGFIAPAGPIRLTLTGGAGISVAAWVVGIPTNNGG